MRNVMIVLSMILLLITLGQAQVSGKAIYFDGLDDVVLSSQTTSLGGTYTIEFWLNGDSLIGGLFHRGNSPYCQYEPGIAFYPYGVFQVRLSQCHGAQIFERRELEEHKWYHIAVVVNNNNQYVYINGELDTVGYKHPWNLNSFHAVGGSVGIDTVYATKFKGMIDEVRIWDVARTQKQIQKTMNDTLGPQYYTTADSGLICYWRFDKLEDLGINGDGADDVRDLSIYGNHGDTKGNPVLKNTVDELSKFMLYADKKIKIESVNVFYGNIGSNNNIKIFKGSPSEYNGNFRALNKIIINRNNQINGNVFAGNKIILIGNSIINGIAVEDTALETIELPVLDFSSGDSNIVIYPHQILNLSPGKYGNIKVMPRGKIVLTSGEYYFNRFILKMNSVVDLSNVSDNIELNIVEKFVSSNKVHFVFPQNIPELSEKITLRLMSNKLLKFGNHINWLGTIIAPNATVVAGHFFSFKGSIYANKIHIGKHAVLLSHNTNIPLQRITEVNNENLIFAPDKMVLLKNYPNPFNPSTTIQYSIPYSGKVRLSIYNSLGQLVNTLVNDFMEAGEYEVKFNGKDKWGNKLTSGIYFARLELLSMEKNSKAITNNRTLKLILMK